MDLPHKGSDIILTRCVKILTQNREKTKGSPIWGLQLFTRYYEATP